MKKGLWEKSWNSGHHYAQFKRQLLMALEPSLGPGDAGRHQREEDTDLFPEELMKKGIPITPISTGHLEDGCS